MNCGTRKFEKFVRVVTYSDGSARRGAFGKARWQCVDRAKCDASHNEVVKIRGTNYGGAVAR